MERKNTTSLDLRHAADEVSDMAKECEKKGLWELAGLLNDISIELHDLARNKNDRK